MKFCCVIWHNGVFNLPTFMLQSDLPADDAAFGHRPPFLWDNAAALERYNPGRPELLRRYASSAPPTLVIHSEKDYRSPITEGLALFQTLQAQGVPSRFLTFEDECHWVLRPENSLVWHQTVWDWMRRCVDGEIKRGDTQW
jgi:dipeptidyl aminopeptidase/acylaminoacyl peptidase